MKKILAMIMSIITVMAASVVSYGAATQIDASGDNGETRVELTYGAKDAEGNPITGARFKVQVPTVLPYDVDEDGNVTVADNAKIQNLCNGQIDVTAVKAETVNGWEIVANGTDFKKVPVDSKQFSMTLNGDNFPAGSVSNLTLGSAWKTIDGQDEMVLPYAGDFAVQSSPLKAAHIANVIFTIAWHTAG